MEGLGWEEKVELRCGRELELGSSRRNSLLLRLSKRSVMGLRGRWRMLERGCDWKRRNQDELRIEHRISNASAEAVRMLRNILT